MTDAFVVPDGHELTTLHNFRDLGGLPTSDGRRTRSGVLFRSDSPHEADEADVTHLVETLGIRSIVDLRSEAEVAADPTNPLVPDSVDYHHLPIAGGPGGAIEGAPTGERLALRYVEYLEHHAPSIVAAVRAVADGENPTVVHCRAGKDRTGVVVALVLAAVGVDESAIAEDYALTTAAMVKIMDRLRASAAYAENVKRLPEEMYSSGARTMLDFLERLRTGHGGASGWLLEHGLSEPSLEALHARLVDDTPLTPAEDTT